MIRRIEFSNFYSFKDTQKISFLTHNKNSYDYFNSKSGDQITKIATFIGGNASGKTNIMRAFSFLAYFTTTKSKDEEIGEIAIPFKTFFNNDTKPSSFLLEFELDSKIFTYELTLQKDSVKKESLLFKEMKLHSKPIVLFNRDLNEINRLNKRYFKNLKSSKLPKIRADISFLPFIKSLYDIDIINKVFQYFDNFDSNINEKGQINIYPYQVDAISLYEKNPEIKEQMLDIVKNFDIGLSSFEITKEAYQDKTVKYTVKGIHKTDSKENSLDFIYESRGTQHLFFILAKILKSLQSNGLAIIDEMEIGLHPEALNKLLTFFLDENEEKKAQLIFTSQSLGILNRLDMQQVFLVEKDSKGSSSLKRLKTRPDENFLNKYLSGSYGAYPKIKI